MSMNNIIAQYIEEIRNARIEDFKDKAAEVEKFRVRFLGRKGVMTELFEQFKTLPNDQKKEMGIALNQLKTAALAKVEEFKSFVEQSVELVAKHLEHHDTADALETASGRTRTSSDKHQTG